jgi:hypothetical protein
VEGGKPLYYIDVDPYGKRVINVEFVNGGTTF